MVYSVNEFTDLIKKGKKILGYKGKLVRLQKTLFNGILW